MFTPNTNIADDYFRKFVDLRFRQRGSCVKNYKLFCLQSSNVSRNQRGVMHPRSRCDDIAGGHVDHLQRAFRHVMDGLRPGRDGAGSSRPRDLHLHRRPQHHPRPHQGLPPLRQQVQSHAERWVSDVAEPRRDQNKGGGPGLSYVPQMDDLSCCRAVPQQLLSGHCLCDILLRGTTVETAVIEVHKLFHIGGVPTSLTLLFWWWLTVSSVFAGRSACTSCSSLPDALPVPMKP